MDESESPPGSSPEGKSKSTGKNPHEMSAAEREARLREVKERAKSVLPGNEITPEGLKEALENPPTQKLPEEQLAAPQEIMEVLEAIKTGVFKGHKVVESFIYRGVPTIKIELASGKVIPYVPGATKEVVAVGQVGDPEVADLATPDTARAWLESILRSYETVNRPIPTQIEESLKQTIIQKIKNTPTLGGLTAHNIPGGGGTEGIQQELLRRVRARVLIHNAALKARFSPKDLMESLGEIISGPDLLIELLETHQTREAINRIVNNNGEFIRNKFTTPVAITLSEEVKASTTITIAGVTYNPGDAIPPLSIIPAGYKFIGSAKTVDEALSKNLIGGGLNEEQAKLSIELGKKITDAFMESAYYDCIVLMDGTPLLPPTHNPDGTRMKYLQTLEWVAKAIEDNWSNIDFNFKKSLGGSGALQGKNTLYYTAFLNQRDDNGKLIQPFPGRAESLRMLAYTYTSSAARYLIKDTNTIGNLAELMDPTANYSTIKANLRDLFRWGSAFSKASDTRGVFNEEGADSILNQPLINPDSVTTGNASQEVSKALGNIKKLEKAYGHLAQGERQKVMSHWLEGILKYLNTGKAWEEDFKWSKWNDFKLQQAINYAYNSGIISPAEAERLEKEFKISRNKAALIAGRSEFIGGFTGTLKELWKALTR